MGRLSWGSGVSRSVRPNCRCARASRGGLPGGVSNGETSTNGDSWVGAGTGRSARATLTFFAGTCGFSFRGGGGAGESRPLRGRGGAGAALRGALEGEGGVLGRGREVAEDSAGWTGAAGVWGSLLGYSREFLGLVVGSGWDKFSKWDSKLETGLWRKKTIISESSNK